MPEYSVQRFRTGWAIAWRDEDGKRRRERLYAEDRPGAEAEARRRWLAQNKLPWTMSRIALAYIAWLEEEAKPSAPRRRDAWKALKGFWERTDPKLIDAQMCKDYAAQRKASNTTIRYELLVISTAVKWARDAKHITARPDMWLPPEDPRKVRHLTKAEFEQFFAAVVAPHARTYVLLGLFTMARPTAILELTWDRVDFERGLIDLNPAGRRQTKKRRPIVKMNEELKAELERAYEARQISFVVERGAKQVKNIKKAFQAASERCGIHVTPYMLRHTGAVWAAEAGISMPLLAQFMGHDDDTTTQRHYARFSPDFLGGVANSVQREKKA